MVGRAVIEKFEEQGWEIYRSSSSHVLITEGDRNSQLLLSLLLRTQEGVTFRPTSINTSTKTLASISTAYEELSWATTLHVFDHFIFIRTRARNCKILSLFLIPNHTQQSRSRLLSKVTKISYYHTNTQPSQRLARSFLTHNSTDCDKQPQNSSPKLDLSQKQRKTLDGTAVSIQAHHCKFLLPWDLLRGSLVLVCYLLLTSASFYYLTTVRRQV